MRDSVAEQSGSRPTILVIGGCGFIAHHLVERLGSENVEIRILSRHRPEGLSPEFAYICGDFRDEAVVSKALKGVNVVFHLANPTGCNWKEYTDRLVDPLRRLAQIAASAGVEQFIYASSIDLYDSARANARITGDTPADPRIARRNHYARAKAACEASLREIEASTQMGVTLLRLGLTIGKGASHAHRGVGHFITATRVRLWGSGMNPLPFVLVEDAADAFVRAMKTPEARGRTLLICAPPVLTARDYMEAVAARADIPIRVTPSPLAMFWAQEALKEAVKHLLRHPNRRPASLHDWKCRAQRAGYDPRPTMQLLGWQPCHDKDAIIARGINPPVDEFINLTSSQPS